MAVTLRKPILVAGLGISAGLWLWESIHDEILAIGEWGLLGAIVLGGAFWFLKQNPSPPSPVLPLPPLKRETAEQAIAQAEAMVALLETEVLTGEGEIEQEISSLKQQVANLSAGFNRKERQIAIAGGKKVGKSTLKQLLEGQEIAEDIQFVEVAALFTETEGTAAPAREVAAAAALVLFLVTGDLTDSEWQLLQQLHASYHRLLLLFNQQDRYLPAERAEILQLLRQRGRELIASADILPIATAPNPVKVRQHQADGSVQERLEQPAAEIAPLGERLGQILQQERECLAWGTVWREANASKQQAKTLLNRVRCHRALPVIEQYQWLAAAAAFANPVAALDLLATAAINAQMLLDLSEIYRQQFSLSQAKAASGAIGKLMVQLGLVELSSQTIASLLKSNALTYVAGGAVQGISAAYLTRLAGLSLIEYFQEQDVSAAQQKGLNWDKLGQKLNQVFEQNQRLDFLSGFVKQAASIPIGS